MDPGTGRELVVAALKGMSQLLFLILAGYYLARIRVLEPSGTKLCSKMVYHLLLPCLLFSSLLEELSVLSFAELWMLPLGAAINLCIGLAVGFAMLGLYQHASGATLSKPLFRAALVACTFCNANQMPILLTSALCSYYPPLRDHKEHCVQKATGYTSMMLMLWSVACWSFAMPFLEGASVASSSPNTFTSEPEPASETQQSGAASANPPQQNSLRSRSAHESNSHLYTMVDVNDHVASSPPPEDDSFPDDADDPNAPDQQALRIKSHPISSPAPFSPRISTFFSLKSWTAKLYDLMLSIASCFQSPPTQSIAVAVIASRIPFVVSVSVPANAPLRVVLDAQGILGLTSLPVASLIVGGNLFFAQQHGFSQSGASYGLVVTVAMSRLVLVPMLALGAFAALQSADLVPDSVSDDPIKKLVQLLVFTMPTANNLVTMCELAGHSQSAASAMLLVQYAIAPLIITASAAAVLSLL